MITPDDIALLRDQAVRERCYLQGVARPLERAGIEERIARLTALADRLEAAPQSGREPPWNAPRTRAVVEAELADVNGTIAELTGWGASAAAFSEWRDDLERELRRMPPAEEAR